MRIIAVLMPVIALVACGDDAPDLTGRWSYYCLMYNGHGGEGTMKLAGDNSELAGSIDVAGCQTGAFTMMASQWDGTKGEITGLFDSADTTGYDSIHDGSFDEKTFKFAIGENSSSTTATITAHRP